MSCDLLPASALFHPYTREPEMLSFAGIVNSHVFMPGWGKKKKG